MKLKFHKASHILYLMLSILTLAGGFSGCRKGNPDFRHCSGMIWNTTYSITFSGDALLQDSVVRELNLVGNSLNVFDSLSTVSRWNRCELSVADSFLKKVYRKSLEVNQATGGYFDPTLGPLIDAWGFGKGHKATGDTARINEIFDYVGMEKTLLRGDSLLKGDPRLRFNFSAIAKGFGCDAVGEMLARNGAADYLVEIGGEIACKGKNPEGNLWRVSIDRPIKSNDKEIHESQMVLEVTDCGIATSGNYRNYQMVNGREVAHTLSPFTGRPVQTDVISCTVVSSTAMEADAYATSMMAMGSEKGKQLAEEKKMKVMLIFTDGDVWMSEGFRKLVKQK